MRILAIGDPVFARPFQLIGADAKICTNEQEVQRALEELVSSEKIIYGVIILPERYVEKTKKIRQKLIKENRAIPVFIFLPDQTGIKDKRIEELKQLVISAIGAEIKL
ncbi:MAG: V-type ATP synthase subunit F [Candidatus Njordarchaeia archaeon]|nr:V-type ATP synthase subunit F [Candidatus Korarchaeota archaeon]